VVESLKKLEFGGNNIHKVHANFPSSQTHDVIATHSINNIHSNIFTPKLMDESDVSRIFCSYKGQTKYKKRFLSSIYDLLMSIC